jgi:RecG-like helicase
MTIFDSIGEDIEEGAINVIRAALEVLILNWSEYSDPTVSRVMTNNPAAASFAAMPIEAKREMLRANCDIKISGISAQIKNSELIPRLQWMMSKAEQSVFSKYFKPFKLLKKSVNALGFYEPDFIVTDDQAESIDHVEETLKKVEEMAGTIEGGNGGGGTGVVATPEAAPPGNEPMIEGGAT